MLQHYVFIKYRPATSTAHIDTFVVRMLALRGLIPEIAHIEIGRDILHDARSWDLLLVMRFATVEALRLYQKHPEHLKVMDFNQPSVEAVGSVDFFNQ